MDDNEIVGVVLQGATSPVERIISTFKVAHVGWEMDNVGAVVELEDGTRRLVLTNHCSPYIADPSELNNLISRYIRELSGMQAALDAVDIDEEEIEDDFT